jgi:hypothetical protein
MSQMPDLQSPAHESRPPSSSNTVVWIILIVVLVLGLMCAGICGGLFLFGWNAFKLERNGQELDAAAEEAAPSSSPAYAESLTRVCSDPRVIDRLKRPIRGAGSHSESSLAGPDRNSVTLDYGISGPADTATVHVVSEEIDGRWWYSELKVTFSDGHSIDLADTDRPIRLDPQR